ncbi:MAG: TIGR02217 family protein [Hyphomicrobium sp.]|uniref:phage distal tail protein, Rcc01695 family n=1 Tax=Hyphomicrobium sp. TaxID=82 RepID=UPI003D0BF356
MSFHEIRFPAAISRGAQGGPERRTDVVVLGSGFEERNSRWAASRRSYNAGYGIATLDALHAVIAFFEERRGRFHGFRWKDHADWKSSAPGIATTALDQPIGIGDGEALTFQLKKAYGSAHAPFVREIRKPVAGTVKIAVAGAAKTLGTHFTVDTTTGLVTFLEGEAPADEAIVTAGFEFDVPVRFDTDKLDINLSGFASGAIPHIPIVEVRL